MTWPAGLLSLGRSFFLPSKRSKRRRFHSLADSYGAGNVNFSPLHKGARSAQAQLLSQCLCLRFWLAFFYF